MIAIPADFPVQPKQVHECTQPVTCLSCNLTWDDAIPTSYTPAPGARCPFEAFHEPLEDPPKYDDDRDLALWFTPGAIRDHFDGDDSEEAAWVAAASDEQLKSIGHACLENDALYHVFHELLTGHVREEME